MSARNFPIDVTHWAITLNGYGQYSFAAPVVIRGRWEERAELFRDGNGDEQMSKVIVYIDTDVNIRDYLAEGDQSGTADPTTLPNAHEIKQYWKTPDLRYSEYLRKAAL